MAAGTLVLDPAAVALADRAELDLEANGVTIRKDPGPDWGDTAIKSFLAERKYGAALIDYDLPPRKIVIPLVVKGSTDGNFDELRVKLQAKVSRINEEGGWLKRKLPSGKIIYADLFEATLHLSAGWYTEHRKADLEAQLEFMALPDFYGDPIALGTFSGTGSAATTAQIKGNLPGRVDFTITEKAGVDQLAAGWAFRCKNYSAAKVEGVATAAWTYDANALTALDATASAALTGSLGGTAMRHNNLGTNWTPVLGTNVGSVAAKPYLTHQGLYDLYARVYTTSANRPWLRFVYDVGDSVAPAINQQKQIPGASGFYLVYLGQVNLRAAPIGTHRWQGAIQARGLVGGENVYVDQLFFLCADESSGVVKAGDPNLTPALTKYLLRDEFNQGSQPTVIGKTAAIGGVYAEAPNSALANWTITGGSALLQTTSVNHNGTMGTLPFKGRGVGTAIEVADPTFRMDVRMFSTSSILQVRVGQIVNYVSNTQFMLVAIEMAESEIGTWKVVVRKPNGTLVASAVIPQLAGQGAGGFWEWKATLVTVVRGTRAQVYIGVNGGELERVLIADDSNFGVSGKAYLYDENITSSIIERLYDNLAIWGTERDAAVFASRTARLTHQGLYRTSEDGIGMGGISRPNGDLARVPVSGPEARPVELAMKLSRGDFETLADSALDLQEGQLSYRPCWSGIPEL